MNLLDCLRHLFLPHHTNNHKARILHPFSVFFLSTVFIVFQIGLNLFVTISPSVLGYASNITPEKVVELTNSKRTERGLGVLRTNGQLNEVALRKAGDMFAFNYWAHTSPSGRDPWSFFQDVGYKYVYAGENLARDFMDSGSAVEAWMNSPTHRDNLLNPKYTEIGVAVVNGTLKGTETTLIVQVFGTPQPSTVAARSAMPQPAIGSAKSTVSEPGLKLVGTTLAKATGEEIPASSLSPFSFTKGAGLLLLGMLIGALAIDGIFVYRKKIVRLSGRNFAHLIFISALLLAVIITHPGAIL